MSIFLQTNPPHQPLIISLSRITEKRLFKRSEGFVVWGL